MGLRNFFCGLFTFLTFTLAAQWSQEINLNTEPGQGHLWPRLQMTSEGAFVIWGHGSSGIIFANQVVDGMPLSNALALNKDHTRAFITAWASTEISADGPNIAVVYKAENAQTGSSYLIRSNDGGASFSDPIEIINGDSILHRFPGRPFGSVGHLCQLHAF